MLMLPSLDEGGRVPRWRWRTSGDRFRSWLSIDPVGSGRQGNPAARLLLTPNSMRVPETPPRQCDSRASLPPGAGGCPDDDPSERRNGVPPPPSAPLPVERATWGRLPRVEHPHRVRRWRRRAPGRGRMRLRCMRLEQPVRRPVIGGRCPKGSEAGPAATAHRPLRSPRDLRFEQLEDPARRPEDRDDASAWPRAHPARGLRRHGLSVVTSALISSARRVASVHRGAAASPSRLTTALHPPERLLAAVRSSSAEDRAARSHAERELLERFTHNGTRCRGSRCRGTGGLATVRALHRVEILPRSL